MTPEIEAKVQDYADVVIVLCSLLRELYGISLSTKVNDKLQILKDKSTPPSQVLPSEYAESSEDA